jgi:hypothetical protein
MKSYQQQNFWDAIGNSNRIDKILNKRSCFPAKLISQLCWSASTLVLVLNKT